MSRKGCLKAFGIVVALMMVLGLFTQCVSQCSAFVVGAIDEGIPVSTIERQALSQRGAPSLSYASDSFYTDKSGNWISSPSALREGMDAFYRKTGVLPYLFILPNGSVYDRDELNSRAESLYHTKFTDERHCVVVFRSDNKGSFNCGYARGSDAQNVVDEEAIAIFEAYLARYLGDSSYSNERAFSRAFEDTGKRIMGAPSKPAEAEEEPGGEEVPEEGTIEAAAYHLGELLAVPLVVAAMVLIVGGPIAVVVYAVRKRKASRQSAEPPAGFSKFSDEEIEQLARKYEQEVPGRQTGDR